jgi:hypothetical protein
MDPPERPPNRFQGRRTQGDVGSSSFLPDSGEGGCEVSDAEKLFARSESENKHRSRGDGADQA